MTKLFKALLQNFVLDY